MSCPQTTRRSSMQILKAYRDGDHTDLTVTCKPLTFEVHALIVRSGCDFFNKSITFSDWKAAEDQCIDFPDDEPEMIRRLITYLYLGDYDPNDGEDIHKYSLIKEHESTTEATKSYHSRNHRNGAGGVLTTRDRCACLAPNTMNVTQTIKDASPTGVSNGNPPINKPTGSIEVANPLTIHARMYALGDKYQVDGLCELAKEKFESCLHHHVRSEDFVSAVQLAYSTTPDSNRGLRDVVLKAFLTEFKINIKKIPGAEASLDTIDKLSFALIKAWPKTEERPKQKEPTSAQPSTPGFAFASTPSLGRFDNYSPAGFGRY